MNLTKYEPNEIVHTKEVPGLLVMEICHKIQESKGEFAYIGPKFPPEMWHQVLSFFKWTYDTTHSESQVRLFVNIELGRWAAWAFPQQARTGMSAQELQTPEGEEQRRMFSDGDGWLYFGTVHHHCSATAFQSGTDETNEKNQHGIHITVGQIDKDMHDLHVRFYLKDSRFEVDMSKFWEIGPISHITPPEVHDRIARWQMSLQSTVEFPAIWKTNLIEPPVIPFQSGVGNGHHGAIQISHNGGMSPFVPFWKRKQNAVKQIEECAKKATFAPTEVRTMLEVFATSDLAALIIKALTRHEVDAQDVITEMDWDAQADQGNPEYQAWLQH